MTSDNEKLIEAKAELARHAGRRDLGTLPGHIRILLDALESAEKAHTPTDDELLDAFAQHYLVPEEDPYFERGSLIAGLRAVAGYRRAEVPEPSAEGYAEFEDWEQEMFRHQPVLSMADGSIAGCQCLDRVFVKGREDWGTHLASVITSRLAQGEPSDAQVRAAWKAFNESKSGVTYSAMRAALRAAGVVGQEGEKR